jgi:starch phosphorylase
MTPIQRHSSDFTPPPLEMTVGVLREAVIRHLTYSLAKTPGTATERDWFHALVYVVRDLLVERMTRTFDRYDREGSRRVYYLSMEYLIGSSLSNALLSLGLEEPMREALQGLDQDYRRLCWLEADAALGNGGLGRLAACLLDSLATLGLAGYGYGIRYEYGMFSQHIEQGWQVEHPENWLRYGNPWELPRSEVLYPVSFGGHVESVRNEAGELCGQWVEGEHTMAMAYDMPVPGYRNDCVNVLRLWSAKSSREFGLQYFQDGDYLRAVKDKTDSENLSRVLYPNDATAVGRELRLKQEFFFVSASLQDILRRHKAAFGNIAELPQRALIQLNDTHPALAVAELMRLLLDEHGLPWEQAWEITCETCAYTNHTLLPEALEQWQVELVERLLPRHLQIIYEINRHLLDEVGRRWAGDLERVRALSLIDESGGRRVRMAHLAIAGSRRVNGVSALHTRLLKTTLFPGFVDLWPERFVNVTNGVSPRRWLNQTNRALSALISEQIGDGWVSDLEQLRRLEPLAGDAGFRAAFREVKRHNKAWLAQVVRWRTGVELDPDSLFDVQVKRIHEYKRQLLFVLYAVTRYNRLRNQPRDADMPARSLIFGGKAAPAYEMAKRILKLINDVAATVNADPRIGGRLRLVFVPNYDVSTAASIIPAADLSEQISTAGMEASGTGNMKLALNGALTIGTLDGANIEIRKDVGKENFFLFGMNADQVQQLRQGGYEPSAYRDANPDLAQALDQIAGGHFSPDDPGRYRVLVEDLLNRDHYLVLADYADYCRCQAEVDALYDDPEEWSRRAVLNVTRMGRYSSDRAVRDYAREVWNLIHVEGNRE